MFGKLSKNTHNVSHKIFHNLQILAFCGFITEYGDLPHSQTSLHAVYFKVTYIFPNAQNRIALTALTALINLRWHMSDALAAAGIRGETSKASIENLYLAQLQIGRGPRNNLIGSKNIADSSPKTPCTAIPKIRNGSVISQTNG
jgi:hypothetical protein